MLHTMHCMCAEAQPRTRQPAFLLACSVEVIWLLSLRSVLSCSGLCSREQEQPDSQGDGELLRGFCAPEVVKRRGCQGMTDVYAEIEDIANRRPKKRGTAPVELSAGVAMGSYPDVLNGACLLHIRASDGVRVLCLVAHWRWRYSSSWTRGTGQSVKSKTTLTATQVVVRGRGQG